MPTPATFTHETAAFSNGATWVIGVDEVGRGCYAGPLLVCACAVNATMLADAPVVHDSKQVSAARRAAEAENVKTWAPIGHGWVSAAEIDDIGMAAALRLGAQRALDELARQGIVADVIIQDGSSRFIPAQPSNVAVHVIVKADATHGCVAAASSVAKVARDRYMAEIAAPGTRYEQWSALATSAGYGTPGHEQQIRDHGLSDLHRVTWSFAARLAGPDAVRAVRNMRQPTTAG